MDIEEQPNESRLLSEELKWDIVFSKQQGLSNKSIAKKLGAKYDRPTLSHQAVKKVVEKHANNRNVENNWSFDGRPRLLDEETELELVEHASENRFDSAKDYKDDLQMECSRETINRTLLRHGYKAYRAPSKDSYHSQEH